MTSSAAQFQCPGCQQAFDWSPDLAGRKLRCACGQIINVPDSLQSMTDVYALDSDGPPPGSLTLDAAGREVQKALPVKTLNYQRQAPATRSDELLDLARAHRRDVVVPVALIGLSLVMLLVVVAFLIRAGRPPAYIVGNIALRLGWDVGITFVASVLIARLLDASLGLIHVAALKVSALAAIRFAVWAVFGMPIPNLFGDLIGFAVSVPVVVILLGYFFELDFRDTFIALTLLTIFRWVSYFGLWRILP